MNTEFVEVISNRANHLIDPHLEFWEWQIPSYLFVGGIVAGMMVLLAALQLKRPDDKPSGAAQWMPFAAIGILSLGMVFLFLDLAHPLHVFRFYMTFEPTSAMSWGSWILLVVYPTLFLLGLSSLDEDRQRRLLAWRPVVALRLPGLVRWAINLATRWRPQVLWASVVLGVGLGVYTGLLLGTMAARPAWNSAALGPLFLVSGVSTGAAAMMLARLNKDELHLLVRWDIAAILLELLLIAMVMIGLSTGGTQASIAGDSFMGGDYTAAFWGLVVVAGLLVPLTLNLLEVKRGIAMTLFAPALILAGGLALRFIFVSAGQAISVSGLG